MTVTALAAAAGALVVGLVAYPPAIAGLRRLGLAQRVRAEGPAAHLGKAGTPTAGGLVFLGFAVVAWLALGRDPAGGLVCLAAIGGAAIGLFDDWLNAKGDRLGLGVRPKLAAQGVVAVGLAVGLVLHGHDLQFIPGLGPIQLGAGAIALVALAGVATSNAVNLADGVDGLAAGLAVPPLAVCAWLAAAQGQRGVAVVCAAAAAGLLAFLVVNRPPARLFMGDTGALGLGFLLAAAATTVGLLVLLPLLGLVFVAEAGSVVLQVAYFKRTGGRRLLRMSPLHHHLELGGLGEWSIDRRLWGLAAAAALGTALLALHGGLAAPGR
ncbi:MAG TPA: phospho-N-acetylmuramoyl-pentapeptide-transferase [Candidatus Micrarchaeia archaeon]|nr:phospho-N-acetylmuramoyl-pentapeptide-transferase [Candidatus Micrarchaeia archaeon]